MPAMSEGKALGEVAQGLFRRSLLDIALSPLKYALSTFGRTDYDGFGQLGATLKKTFGAENVLLAGDSKGGGEVMYMAAMNGLRGYTFNAAGMSATSLDQIRKNFSKALEIALRHAHDQDARYLPGWSGVIAIKP